MIAERDGHGWRVRVHGVGGPAGVHARDLSDLEPRVRKLIWSYIGTHPADIELDVEIRLPPAIQLRLDLASQLCQESSTEIDGAIDDMVDAHFSVSDINRIIWSRCGMPRRFMITNDEILRYGLEPFPDALGVRWDDHGRFMTVTCRDCVEATRKSYVDVPPDGQNVIVYEGPLVCDCCEEEYRPAQRPCTRSDGSDQGTARQ
ncbi:MAG: hypothetical protein ACRD2C_10455 [Acidimicrobiales bacterium]